MNIKYIDVGDMSLKEAYKVLEQYSDVRTKPSCWLFILLWCGLAY